MWIGILAFVVLIGLILFFKQSLPFGKKTYRSVRRPPSKLKAHKSKTISKKQAPKKKSASKKKKHGEFYCVEIHSKGKICDVAKKIKKIRFLSAEAPAFPLQGCDQEHCHCDYIHHEDRRVRQRRYDFSLQHKLYDQAGIHEHATRKSKGRRITDA